MTIEKIRKNTAAIKMMFAGIDKKRRFRTVSDRGSVKFKVGRINLLVPNEYGDGDTEVAIFEKGDTFNWKLMNEHTKIEGRFEVCYGDCSEEIIRELNGNYEIYSFNRYVAIVNDKVFE